MTNLLSAGTCALLLCTAQASVAQQAAPSDAIGAPTYTSSLMTRWGHAVTPANAWRSYPRPQMKRDRWLNLNGRWDYAIRPETAAQPAVMDGQILVPFAPESKLSGVARSVRPHDRLWYHRTFAVPADWSGQDVLLHFGAVDYDSHVYVNGALVGSHRGGSDSFDFNVTDFLKPGQNDLVVQVADPSSAGEQPRGKQQLGGGKIWYTPVSGIWQTVWLEPVPRLHVEDMKITPDIDAGTLNVTVALNHSAGDEDAVRITALEGARTVSSVLVRANRAASLPIPQPHLWSPDDPYLYDLKVELVKVRDPYAPMPADVARHDRGAELLTEREAQRYAHAAVVGPARDTLMSYFAMRKSSIGRGSTPGQPVLELNNKPLFQNGTLDQGWWPDGLLTPPSEDAIRWELGFLKKAGFNMLRKHIKVEPAQYYYEADRMGLLIWQDMPSGMDPDSLDEKPRDSSQFEAVMPQAVTNELESELERMIAELRNHPSIVTWVVNNEGWGQYDSTRLGQLVKNLDPSRVVDKASGWLDTGDKGSDLYDIHTYEDVPRYPGHHGERAIVIGEYGGVGLPIPGHLWFPANGNWGYQGAKDAADFEARYRRKVEEVIRQAQTLGLSAAVYTQTSDVEGEVNGLLTYDRAASKIPVDRFAAINAPLVERH